MQTIESKLQRYQSYLAGDPDNPNLLSDIADLYLQLGDIKKAYDHSQKAAAGAPAKTDIQFRHATIALANGLFDEAIDRYRAIEDQGTVNDVLRFNLAYAYVYKREFAMARDQLAMIQDTEALPQSKKLMARVLHHLGQLEEAIALLQNYIDAHRDDTEATGMMALILIDNGHNPLARQWAEQTLQHDPTNLEALVSAATDAMENEEPGAVDMFAQAVQHHPQSGRAWSGLGMTQMQQEDLLKATQSLEHAVQYMPNHLGTWHALAWCYILQDNIEQAKQCYEQAMALDRNFAENHGGMAIIDIMQGKPEEAKLKIRRALRIDRMSFSALFAQSMLDYQNGNEDRSAKTVQNIINEAAKTGGKKLLQTLQSIGYTQNSRAD